MKTLENLTTSEYERAATEAHAFAENLARAEAIPALAEAFAETMPEHYEEYHPIRKLMWLKGFANKHLDIRKGKERQGVDKIEYTPEQEAAVSLFTQEFGMEGETNATKREYGFISILGGANQSNLLRVRHAKKQLDAGVVAPYMLLLGSARPVSEKEAESASNYVVGAQTEFDLLNGALEAEFGVTSIDEVAFDTHGEPADRNDPDAGLVRYYELPNGTKVLSVSAPRVEGEKRANTPDTYHFIANIIGKERFREGKSILAVTTDLYVPFQHADALRLLALQEDLEVETIGYGGVDRPTQSYAGEINSAVNQTYMLKEELLKLEDYVDAMHKDPVTAGTLESIQKTNTQQRRILVGKVMLYIVAQASRRQAELDGVIASFTQKKYMTATLSGLSDRMHWELESDLAHDEPVIGGPHFSSPYAYAAERGIQVVPSKVVK